MGKEKKKYKSRNFTYGDAVNEIKKIDSVGDIKKFIKKDGRVTVNNAADKRIKFLKEQKDEKKAKKAKKGKKESKKTEAKPVKGR